MSFFDRVEASLEPFFDRVEERQARNTPIFRFQRALASVFLPGHTTAVLNRPSGPHADVKRPRTRSGRPSGLPTLTKDRIRAVLDESGDERYVTSSGNIVSPRDGGTLHFMTVGERGDILQVRGLWSGRLSSDQAVLALQLVNKTNYDTLWMKAYLCELPSGETCVLSDTTADYEHGVTDDQLRQHLTGAAASSMQLFKVLDEEFPIEAAIAARTLAE